jgi:hypothetical protein
VNVTLAIYITLAAVALVAVAQILIWKLVITRGEAAGDDTAHVAGWGPEPLEGLMAHHAVELVPVLAEEPLCSEEPLGSEEPEPSDQPERVLVGV